MGWCQRTPISHLLLCDCLSAEEALRTTRGHSPLSLFPLLVVVLMEHDITYEHISIINMLMFLYAHGQGSDQKLLLGCSCGDNGEYGISSQRKQLGHLLGRVHALLALSLSHHCYQLYGDSLPPGPTWGLLV